jgi:hypothetical protein
MNSNLKKVLVLSVAMLSMSAFADAKADQGDRRHYKGHRHAPAVHQPRHKRVRARHYRGHKHARAQHYRGHKRAHKRAHKYRHGQQRYRGHARRHVAYAQPAYGTRATIWVDGIGFSFYSGR